MTTWRSRFERRSRVTKAQEERLLESLEETVDTLADVIDAIETGEQADFMDGIEVAEVLLAKAKRRLEQIQG